MKVKSGAKRGNVFSNRLQERETTGDGWQVVDKKGGYVLFRAPGGRRFTVDREVAVGGSWGYLEVAGEWGEECRPSAIMGHKMGR